MQQQPEHRQRRVPAIVAPLLRVAPGQRRAIFFVAGTSFVAGALEAFVLVLIAHAALAVSAGDDRIEVLGRQLTLAAALAAAAASLAGKVGMNAVAARRASAAAAAALTDTRRSSLAAFFDATWARQSRERVGELQELMTTHVDRVATATLQTASLVGALLNVAALAVTSLIVSPAAAVLIVITGLAVSGLLRPLQSYARRVGAEQADAGRAFASGVSEGVSVAKDAKVFGVNPPLLERLMDRSHVQADAYRRSRFASLLTGPLYQALTLGLVVGGLAALRASGATDIDALGSVVLLQLRALSYGQQAQTAMHQLHDVAAYLDEVSSQRDSYRGAAEPVRGADVPRLTPLVVDQLRFAYAGAPEVLHGISFTVDPGETLGIVGPSGSGKSTVVELLLRLREPTTGQLRAGGVPADEVALAQWRRRLAFVPQAPRLLHGTIAENIAFLRPVPTPAIEEAARLAGLHDEIAAMPLAYQTVIGSGTNLSGGQTQRLCIARALVSQPDLLILDEPTSALDLRSEARIQDTLRTLRGEVAVVIVAHRLSTVSACDRVLVLVGGEIEALAPPSSLADVSPFFSEAVRLSRLPT